ncbi:MAG: hypothetical protein CMC18_05625 [Flavobacteriaceae bacterium]|nr:hypothetical protein [Flavobacteriaceae bacterium]
MRLQIITLSFLLCSTLSWSQRKSDLLMEIQQLKTTIEQQNDSIRKLRSELLSKSALIETYSNDLRDMRETNTNLMNTMGKFTSESVANTMKVNSKLANINDIEKKAEQIRGLMLGIDSINISAAAGLNQTISAAQGLKIEEASLQFPIANLILEMSDSLALEPKLIAVNQVINTFKGYQLTITGNLDKLENGSDSIAFQLYDLFTNVYAIEPDRIQIAPSGNLNFTFIKLSPDFTNVYMLTKQILR